jgi:hypothetical protein
MHAGAAGGAAYVTYTSLALQQGAALWVTGALTALSWAAALFCIYNVLAGGNPPRKGSH